MINPNQFLAARGLAIRLLKKLPSAFFLWFLICWGMGYFGTLSFYFELASHFKLQYLFGSFIFAILFALLRQWRWTATALGCALISSLSIIPWYVPKSLAQSPKSGRQVRLLLSNVWVGNSHYDKLLELIRAENPDLIFGQEITAPWAQTLNKIRDAYPYGIVKGAAGLHDATELSVISRLPLLKIEEVGLGNFNGPSYELHTNIGNQLVTIVTIHPPPPDSKFNLKYRNKQFNLVADYVRKLPEPKIVIGDLNVTMWSPYYNQFVEQMGLVSAREGFGVLPTWPAFLPIMMKIPIDHCLISRDLRVIKIRTGPPIGSDHLPLIVDLEIPQKPE